MRIGARNMPSCGPGHTHDEIETVPTHEEADCHVVLGSGERGAEALLEANDSIERGLLFHLRSVIAGQLLGHSRDALLVGKDAPRRPHLLSAPGHDWQSDRVAIRENRLDRLVERRDGQAVKVRGGGDDHVASGEGLLLRKAPIRAE
jgi:hypothetical protein